MERKYNPNDLEVRVIGKLIDTIKKRFGRAMVDVFLKFL